MMQNKPLTTPLLIDATEAAIDLQTEHKQSFAYVADNWQQIFKENNG